MRFAASSVAFVAACSFVPQHGQPVDARSDDGPATNDARKLPDAPASDGRVPDAPANGFAVLQQADDHADDASSIAVSFTNPPTAGHVLLMIGGESNGSDTTVTGVGSGWTRVAGSWEHLDVEIWYAIATGSGTAVTLDESDGKTQIFMSISELGGVVTPSAFDIGGPASGQASGMGGTTARAGAIQTSAADVIVLAVSSSSTTAIATPTGEVALEPITADYGVIGGWYEIEDTPSSYNPGVSAPGSWDAAVAAFKLQ
jgi:hypothetical protein